MTLGKMIESMMTLHTLLMLLVFIVLAVICAMTIMALNFSWLALTIAFVIVLGISVAVLWSTPWEDALSTLVFEAGLFVASWPIRFCRIDNLKRKRGY